MKRTRFTLSTVVSIAAASALCLLGASAASADGGASAAGFSLSATSVSAGGNVVVTGSSVAGAEPVAIVTFETPTASSPGNANALGSSGGTILVTKTVPATVPWSVTVTVPAATPPGAGYHVCGSVEEYDASILADLHCVELTVTAAGGSSSVPSGPNVTVARSTTTPGGTLDFSGRGFTPGEQVAVTAHSTPVQLAVVTADANGVVSGSVKVPAGFPVGAHTLELKGATSGVVVTTAFTVGAVPAAATDVLVASAGARIAQGVGAVLALAVAATCALVWRRRRATA